jgi:hypothetical protein
MPEPAVQGARGRVQGAQVQGAHARSAQARSAPWVALIVCAVVAAGCAPREELLLAQFFGASRLRDRTALAGVSTVTFEPREQGIVRTFRITAVTPERRGGAEAAKDVTVEAPVVLPDGRTVQESLVVTMRRAASGERAAYGWIITGVTTNRAGAAGALRPS